MALTHKYYEMTREEIHLMWMKKINHIWFNKDREFYFQKGSTNNFHWFYWLPLSRNLDIIGCYFLSQGWKPLQLLTQKQMSS